MKRFILSAAALAASLGQAFAADLPSTKAPPLVVPPPPPLWTGFYVGLNAGYTWNDRSAVSLVSPYAANPYFITANPIFYAFASQAAMLGSLQSSGVLSAPTSGFIGGGQIGYNYQFAPQFVAGIEADIQGVAASSSPGTAFAPPVLIPGFGTGFAMSTGVSARRSTDYIGTLRGRLGYLVTPSLLVYGTGGLAYGGVSGSFSILQGVSGISCTRGDGCAPYFSNGAYSDTRVGWTAGGGVEWMFFPNWSAKVEYLHYDLGGVSFSSTLVNTLYTTLYAPVGTPAYWLLPTARASFSGNIVRAGVNYHFNWGAPAPVLAKY